jgi:O-antigen ligase
MPPQLALLLATGFVVFVFVTDRSRAAQVTGSFLWPTLWFLIAASRPFGFWVGTFGIPIPGDSSGDPTEGSPIDRNFMLFLLGMGLWVLARRRFSWKQTLSKNAWAVALLAFMLLSILWSDYTFVSFKRWIKAFGSLVMALVVLSNDRPLEAILTVLRRCLYIHLPMSIICIKYFRDIGVAYDWSGAGMWWQGISTSKNTLGQIVMLAVIYFSFELYRNWSRWGWRTVHSVYLLMALHLLRGGSGHVSMTSVSVTLIAVTTFVVLQYLRKRGTPVGTYIRTVFTGVTLLVALVLTHSIVHFSPDSLFGSVITTLGRDITLTDRTYIWSDVYAQVDNPLIGVGYGGFWIGRIANIPWSATMSWILGQAHSGYVDTYLQIGWIGGFLFAGVVFATMPRLLQEFEIDFDLACLRTTLFVTILFVNITESTFLRGEHPLWFVFQLTIWPIAFPRRASVKHRSPASNQRRHQSAAARVIDQVRAFAPRSP